jgi:hypothetical protein
MLKKLVVTVIAGAAVSIPLGGGASADPSANSNGVGAKGVPGEIGANYYGVGKQVQLGNPLSGAAITKAPGTSLPDAFGGPGGQQMKQGLFGGPVNNGYNGEPTDRYSGGHGNGSPNCCA